MEQVNWRARKRAYPHAGWTADELMQYEAGAYQGEDTVGGELLLLEMTPERRAMLDEQPHAVAWLEKRLGDCKAKAARHQARKKGAYPNDFIANDWQEVLVAFEDKCAYCGRDDVCLEQEHVVPLSRGGSHTIGNIVPACGTCNTKKQARTPAEAGMMLRRLPVVHFEL